MRETMEFLTYTIVENFHEPKERETMKLTSLAFEHGGKIPPKYTCDGENINPPLTVSDVPSEAHSFVLIMDDPDVPKHLRGDGMWDHWVVFNIPATIRDIKEGKERNLEGPMAPEPVGT
jgi:Raf kinase inhibitor-like YbhB/YbcL family protein